MSRPAPGTYAIINRALSVQGHQLVITFNGEGNDLTAGNRTGDPSQQWQISDHSDGKNSYVIPKSAPSLQVASGDGVLITLPAGGYVWTIKETDSGYSIQNGGLTGFWGIAFRANPTPVTIGDGTGDETQIWFLEKVA